MYHKMKRMFRIGTLVLMLLTVWAAGCNTAKFTHCLGLV
jgi:predicted small secreted protein